MSVVVVALFFAAAVAVFAAVAVAESSAAVVADTGSLVENFVVAAVLVAVVVDTLLQLVAVELLQLMADLSPSLWFLVSPLELQLERSVELLAVRQQLRLRLLVFVPIVSVVSSAVGAFAAGLRNQLAVLSCEEH